MNTTFTIITIAVVLVMLALVYFNYIHKNHIQFTEDELKANIKKIYSDNNVTVLRKKDFVRLLKNVYSCSSKEALYLLGQARKLDVVEDNNREVKLAA